jgi:hypothetical protein
VEPDKKYPYPYQAYGQSEWRYRKPRKPRSPAWALFSLVPAICWLLFAALESGTLVQWLIAGGWAFIAGRDLWQTYRARVRRR